MQALLLDFDGTIIDSLPTIFNAYLDLMKEYDFTGSYHEFMELQGPSLLEILELLKKRYNLLPSAEFLTKKYVQNVLDRTDECHLFPGTREFLDYCKGRDLSLALVTSAQRHYAEHLLEYHELIPYFDAVITCEDVPRTKPFPDIYRKAVKELDVPSYEAMVVEDTVGGAAAGVAANLLTTLISHGKKFPSHDLNGVVPIDNWEAMQNFMEEKTWV